MTLVREVETPRRPARNGLFLGAAIGLHSLALSGTFGISGWAAYASFAAFQLLIVAILRRRAALRGPHVLRPPDWFERNYCLGPYVEDAWNARRRVAQLPSSLSKKGW